MKAVIKKQNRSSQFQHFFFLSIGETLYTERKLKPETSPSEYAAGADENVNVQAITEYAASVGRVSHSMIKSLVKYVGMSILLC